MLEDLEPNKTPHWWSVSISILGIIAIIGIALIAYGLGVLHTLLTFSFK